MDEENRIVREISKGLLRWYEFKEGCSVLYIGKPEEALPEFFRDRGFLTVCREPSECLDEGWLAENRGCFQYVVCIVKLEEQRDPVRILKAWRELLGSEGRLLLGMNNRLGLRYFCGDRDPYTDRNYDGIENYRDSLPESWQEPGGGVQEAGEEGKGQKNGEDRGQEKKEQKDREGDRQEEKEQKNRKESEQEGKEQKSSGWKGRCYSSHEIKEMLHESGCPAVNLFSVLPDLEHPQLIYREDSLPNEELSSRLFPMYHNPGSVFLKEEYLYTDLAENGMFHAMANAFLAECSLDGEFSDIRHVTLASERGASDACMTIIHEADTVEKRALYPQGQMRIAEIAENLAALRSRGIDTVDFEIRDDRLLMPYVEAESVQSYFRKLLLADRDFFIREVDRFRDLILASSEHVPGGGEDGILLERGYLDLVPLNSFYLDGKYVVYDQEFCMENCPANLVIMRMLCSLYFGNDGMEKLLPVKFFFDRYGITPRLDYWKKMELDFIIKLRREGELYNYHIRNRRNDPLTERNRQRMNFSEEEYQRRFVDIFRNTEKKKLVLFGSGKVAARFLAIYRHEYEITCLLDNARHRWGDSLEGIPIQSPSFLQDMRPGEYQVIICIRAYLPVMRQLEEMGVRDYSVYEPERDYPRRRRLIFPGQDNTPNKYHIGYTAGVFDLFHIGHLNLLKRSKEMCDYLIVGVVTDEQTLWMKGKKPFVPFEERLEIVRSCRYVDEVVVVPPQYPDIQDAYGIYHFDCQFSGSDHAEDPHWLEQQRYLRERGSDLYFFPYTQGTSSTMLQEVLKRERSQLRDIAGGR